MEFSLEKDNFLKVSYILKDIVPRHFREYFVKLWDQKYPNKKWSDDIAKRNLKLQSLLVVKDGEEKQDPSFQTILKGNEQEWDITICVRAILEPSLNLLKGCRSQDQQSIEIIQKIQNSHSAHLASMLYTADEFTDVMSEVKGAAKNLFGAGAEREILKIALFPIDTSVRENIANLYDGKLV